jgi:hypothetical protein
VGLDSGQGEPETGQSQARHKQRQRGPEQEQPGEGLGRENDRCASVEASPARRFCFVDKQKEDSSEWEKKNKIK